ncbi:putative RT14 protein [Monocercomonoides exilis]|uniref:putative RT14 protein n=1 Tax=Monocercomonoides exilis TaxID=2049356 RepID=UPI003559BE4B|nr:putative RT14 protein [Monocercomonoides exilis]|eukprot:MONOS_249.1-p1 / transcript=MONOS_249.1 / gene=MONOS_249 / organism=Monocercomonoides_exilis_PA203 / gene_product=RT14 protein / transcript_product=RT14 protein / location=Mono_scaffold00004:122640-123192(-) / protein_length=122 / sequence_SO=supercontig / SO=protein_coding / is_pseudo=false
MSLSQLLKDHQVAQSKRKEQIEFHRKNALRCATVLGDELSETINALLTEIFSNQKQLDAETKRLQINTSKFLKQSQQWLQLSNQLVTSFKELGDVGNFLQTISNEMKIIADACTACAESGLI